MSQEEAVRRMTSQPAAQMQLVGRGAIRKGAFADITLFDPQKIADRASYAEPHRAAEGIECVLVNGVPVLEGGEYRAEARAGQVLRRS
jgi:N-acyl-D-amino-acid deacylase